MATEDVAIRYVVSVLDRGTRQVVQADERVRSSVKETQAAMRTSAQAAVNAGRTQATAQERTARQYGAAAHAARTASGDYNRAAATERKAAAAAEQLARRQQQVASTAAHAAHEVRAAEHEAGRGARGFLEASGAVHGLGRNLIFASGAFVSGAAIGEALHDIVTESKDAQISTALLSRQVQQLGLAHAGTAKRIEERVAATSKLSGFDRSEVRTSLTRLLSLTKSVGNAFRDESIAVNVARARHIGLTQATQLVSKAQMGTVGALRRVGIEADKVTTAQDNAKKVIDAYKVSVTKASDTDQKHIAVLEQAVKKTKDNQLAHDKAAAALKQYRDQNLHLTAAETAHIQSLKDQAKAADLAATRHKALATLQGRFAGQARAYGHTAAGAIDEYHNSIKELNVALGDVLLPTIVKVLNPISKYVNSLTDSGRATKIADSAVKGASEAFRDFVPPVENTLKGLYELAKNALPTVVQVMRVTGTVTRALGGFLDTGLGRGVLKVVTAMYLLNKAIKTVQLVTEIGTFQRLSGAIKGVGTTSQTAMGPTKAMATAEESVAAAQKSVQSTSVGAVRGIKAVGTTSITATAETEALAGAETAVSTRAGILSRTRGALAGGLGVLGRVGRVAVPGALLGAAVAGPAIGGGTGNFIGNVGLAGLLGRSLPIAGGTGIGIGAYLAYQLAHMVTGQRVTTRSTAHDFLTDVNPTTGQQGPLGRLAHYAIPGFPGATQQRVELNKLQQQVLASIGVQHKFIDELSSTDRAFITGVAGVERYRGQLDALKATAGTLRDANTRLMAAELDWEGTLRARPKQWATWTDAERKHWQETRTGREWVLRAREAYSSLTDAKREQASASKAATTAEEAHTVAVKDGRRSIDVVTASYRKAANAAKTKAGEDLLDATRSGDVTKARKALQDRTEALAGVVDDYATAERNLAQHLNQTGRPALAMYAQVAADLAQHLQDIPTAKQVRVQVQIDNLPTFQTLLTGLREVRAANTDIRIVGIARAEVAGRAGGGRIPGARTAADSVPALLSPQEFVVTGGGERILEQMTFPGVLHWLEHVQPRHYATGGRVLPLVPGWQRGYEAGLDPMGAEDILPDLRSALAPPAVHARPVTAKHAATRTTTSITDTAQYGRVVGEASRINNMHLPYVYGGGHVTPAPANGPFDCSSAVSRVLQAAGFDIPTMTSSGYLGWGVAGRGRYITTMAKPGEGPQGHVYAVLGGRAWGTSQSNPGGGPGWISAAGYPWRSGFVARHPQGYQRGGRVGARYVLPGPNPGLVRRGNIDIAQRMLLHVPNPHGGYSSVDSTSFSQRGLEVLVPQVVHRGGRWQVVGPRAAWAYYGATGQFLGAFDNVPHADRYAQRLHLQQASGHFRAGGRVRMQGGGYPYLAGAGLGPGGVPGGTLGTLALAAAGSARGPTIGAALGLLRSQLAAMTYTEVQQYGRSVVAEVRRLQAGGVSAAEAVQVKRMRAALTLVQYALGRIVGAQVRHAQAISDALQRDQEAADRQARRAGLLPGGEAAAGLAGAQAQVVGQRRVQAVLRGALARAATPQARADITQRLRDTATAVDEALTQVVEQRRALLLTQVQDVLDAGQRVRDRAQGAFDRTVRGRNITGIALDEAQGRFVAQQRASMRRELAGLAQRLGQASDPATRKQIRQSMEDLSDQIAEGTVQIMEAHRQAVADAAQKAKDAAQKAKDKADAAAQRYQAQVQAFQDAATRAQSRAQSAFDRSVRSQGLTGVPLDNANAAFQVRQITSLLAERAGMQQRLGGAVDPTLRNQIKQAIQDIGDQISEATVALAEAHRQAVADAAQAVVERAQQQGADTQRAISRGQAALDRQFRTAGIDSGSMQGLSVTAAFLQHEKSQLAALRAQLLRQLQAAQATGDQAAITAVQQQLEDVNDQLAEADTQLAESQRNYVKALADQATAAAQNVVDMAQAQMDLFGAQQRLAGTADTPAGMAARGNFIKDTLVPALQQQMASLQQQLAQAVQDANTQLANQLQVQIVQIQAQILNSMADAADLAKQAAEAAAQAAVDIATHTATMANLGLANLELQQRLNHTFDTTEGRLARVDFISHSIVDALRRELGTLRDQQATATAQGDDVLARQIAEAIAGKQNDILQAQLDAQELVEQNTAAMADALKQLSGSLTFELGSERFTDNLLGALVGA